MTPAPPTPGPARADRRGEVLAALRSSSSPLSILDLAGRLGLHPNTVRFHLRVLAESGRVEQVPAVRGATGRPPSMFRAHGGMDPAGPRSYRVLAEVLATSLGADDRGRDKAVEAGRAWGARLADTTTHGPAADDEEAITLLVDLLDDLGFAPERRSSEVASQVGLTHCPFLDLVPEHGRVICPMHLGLMQGVLAGLGAGVGVERLEPFAEPDLCLAHLGEVSR